MTYRLIRWKEDLLPIAKALGGSETLAPCETESLTTWNGKVWEEIAWRAESGEWAKDRGDLIFGFSPEEIVKKKFGSFDILSWREMSKEEVEEEFPELFLFMMEE